MKSRRAAALLVVSCLLVGCGGGGGGGGSPTDTGGETTPTAGASVGGVASKGPLAGATVCVYAADTAAANGLGAQIVALAGGNVSNGCYTTGADGSFTLTLPATATGDLVLVASGGRYCSNEAQVTGGACADGNAALLEMPAGAVLSAPLTLPAGSTASFTVNLTPLSQAAWQNARAQSVSFDAAFAALVSALGLPQGVTAATVPDDGTAAGTALKSALRQVALSVATEGSASLDDAIATLAQGSVPPIGTPSKACAGKTALDAQLRCLLAVSDVTRLEAPPAISDAMFYAGRNLFASTALSGTGNASCSSCHPINNAGVEGSTTINGAPTVRALHLSLRGGPASGTTNNTSIHRNAPDLVNKLLGNPRYLFWDGRVALGENGAFVSPAGDQLPAGLDSLLAVQALFPLLSREEMLGFAPGTNGGLSENASAALVADPVETDPVPVWNAVMERVKADAALFGALQSAFPTVPATDLGIQHVANAIAAYETRRWNPAQSSYGFHGYLAGTAGLTDAAKRGGILFFDKAGCFRCHSGPKLSDSKFHNLAVPQIGPGFGSGARETPPRDYGRYEVTGQDADRYAFLTPSLWEVRATAPYFHNGVYASLEKTVRHHLDAAAAAQAFRCATDAPPLQTGVTVACRDSLDAATLYADMVSRLDTKLPTPGSLSDAEIADLLAFLRQLTDGQND